MAASPRTAVAPPRVQLRPSRPDFRLLSPGIAVASLVGCTFLLRLPAALLPRELNIDESQAISQAMKLSIDPRPWISVDGQSCGPIHSYLITAFGLLGLTPGFVLAHIVASVLACLQVWLVYATVRRIASQGSAALGGMVVAFLFGFTGRFDYLHYSGELLPTVLLLASLYMFVQWPYVPPEQQSRVMVTLFLGGLALGAAPWCKLQAGPMTAGLGLVFVIALLRNTSFTPSSPIRIAEMAAFAIGAVLTTAIMLAALLHTGAMRDFWYSYILGNLQYSNRAGSISSIAKNALIFATSPVNPLLFLAFCVLVCCSLTTAIRPLSVRQRWAVAAILVYCVTAAFAVCRVRFQFPHHTILLIAPFTCGIAVGAYVCNIPGVIRKQEAGGKWKEGVLIALAVSIVLFCAAYVSGYVRLLKALHEQVKQEAAIGTMPRDAPDVAQPDGGEGSSQWLNKAVVRIAPVQSALSEWNQQICAALSYIPATHAVRSLAIWGWAPGVYVLSEIPSATRDSNSFFVIQKGSLQSYYRSRYIGDLRDHQPDVFVDALTQGTYMWEDWTESDRYESIPDLRNYIDRNYISVGVLTLQQGAQPVRFFLRRDLCCRSR